MAASGPGDGKDAGPRFTGANGKESLNECTFNCSVTGKGGRLDKPVAKGFPHRRAPRADQVSDSRRSTSVLGARTKHPPQCHHPAYRPAACRRCLGSLGAAQPARIPSALPLEFTERVLTARAEPEWVLTRYPTFSSAAEEVFQNLSNRDAPIGVPTLIVLTDRLRKALTRAKIEPVIE